jgi:hypothetical protein
MEIRSKEPLGTKSVPAPRMISLPEQALADGDEARRDEASEQNHFWVRTSNYPWAMGAMAVGLSLHFYYMREMLVSLALFSLLFLSLSLAVLSVLCFCYAGRRAAIWAGPAAWAVMALMQQGFGCTESARVPVVEDGRRFSGEVRRRMQ